jgi:2-polyprenyl-3-methyl-5-hydroxy-6-metoxy-1,4-benzoquinol methylase
MGEDVDSYQTWRSTYNKGKDWEATFQRGQWNYLDEVGELPRYAVIAGYIHKLLPGGDVLDAGCGEAVFSQYLDLERFRYTGIDLSPTAIERAGRRLRRGTVRVSSIEEFSAPAGERYCAVVFNESIQLTDTPLESIDRYREFLTPEGLIVISLFRTADERGNGPRLARFLVTECENGRYSLVDRCEAVSVSHSRVWEIFVLR